MPTMTEKVTGARIKAAIEGRDGRARSGMYAEEAGRNVIDRNTPPSRPREVRGRAAISAFPTCRLR